MVDFMISDDKARSSVESQIQAKIKDMRSGKQVLDEDALEILSNDTYSDSDSVEETHTTE